ncbi:hypothetical protein DERF_010548 [Dermatophagoides farinae]|uniref:Uncharacterized protein n=1 Tax=Dermatophagoides farinae TaxID=6954 RepID=A0A922L3N2_DERFA|nr:hypothetical protein DERF_010548 [Dermatophagoides farinae]
MENQQQPQQSSSSTTTIPQPPRQQQQQQSNHLQNKLIYGNHIDRCAYACINIVVVMVVAVPKWTSL